MPTQFKTALSKLLDDDQYRDEVKNDPRRIVSDFQFTDAELGMLVAIGQTAGGDSAAGMQARMVCASSCSSGGGPGVSKPTAALGDRK
jgi:hypothetical protein